MGLQDGKYSHLVQNTSHILLLYILNLCLGILKMHFCWIIALLEKKKIPICCNSTFETASFWIPLPLDLPNNFCGNTGSDLFLR